MASLSLNESIVNLGRIKGINENGQHPKSGACAGE
jgi:hypothetical protein